jgi:hypothetical protein
MFIFTYRIFVMNISPVNLIIKDKYLYNCGGEKKL